MAKKAKKTRFAPKLHIKKGDRVMVIAGNDKGETGEVLEVFPAKNRAIVENLNMVKKHQKPTQDNPGGIIDLPAGSVVRHNDRTLCVVVGLNRNVCRVVYLGDVSLPPA